MRISSLSLARIPGHEVAARASAAATAAGLAAVLSATPASALILERAGSLYNTFGKDGLALRVLPGNGGDLELSADRFQFSYDDRNVISKLTGIGGTQYSATTHAYSNIFATSRAESSINFGLSGDQYLQKHNFGASTASWYFFGVASDLDEIVPINMAYRFVNEMTVSGDFYGAYNATVSVTEWNGEYRIGEVDQVRAPPCGLNCVNVLEQTELHYRVPENQEGMKYLLGAVNMPEVHALRPTGPLNYVQCTNALYCDGDYYAGTSDHEEEIIGLVPMNIRTNTAYMVLTTAYTYVEGTNFFKNNINQYVMTQTGNISIKSMSDPKFAIDTDFALNRPDLHLAVSSNAASVPEPSIWAMLILAFLSLGARLRLARGPVATHLWRRGVAA